MDNRGFYVNRVGITSSLYDFYFKFSAKIPQFDDQGNIIGEELIDSIDLLMSPKHAEALYEALGTQLEAHKQMLKSATTTDSNPE